MEDGKTENTPNEFEVVEMFWVDGRVRVDLQGVVVVLNSKNVSIIPVSSA